jgi:putative DNA primase/helicase
MSNLENESEPLIRIHKPKGDARTERQIITGAIISDEFLKRIQAICEPGDFQAGFAGKVASWCFDFWQKYGKAPGKDIESFFLGNKEGLPEEEVRLIEDFLSSISGEYERTEQTFNADYTFDIARKYIRQCADQRFKQEVQRAKTPEDYAEAIARRKAKLDGIDGQDGKGNGGFDIGNSLVGLGDFLKLPIPQSPVILSPWMRQGTLAMCHSYRGTGKTMFGLSVSLAVCTGGEIGPWKCTEPTNVLYIDAEMNANELQEARLPALMGCFPKVEDMNRRLTIYSADLNHLNSRPTFNITIPAHRENVYRFLKETRQDIGLLVLDNISALSPGLDEIPKESWDPIAQWLLSLRFLGVAVLLFHHSGKTGKQRGTSGREDALDIVLKLEHPAGYKPEEGCKFVVTFEKHRSLKGDDVKPIQIHVTEAAGKTVIRADTTKTERRKLIIAALGRGIVQKEIAKRLCCSEGTITNTKKGAIEQGYLNEKGEFTPEGLRLFGQTRWEED